VATENQNQPLWFLKAKTEIELHRLMVLNNQRFNKRFHYLNPVFARGYWVTWFEIPKSDLSKDELNNVKE
jgi:hypothetical protein